MYGSNNLVGELSSDMCQLTGLLYLFLQQEKDHYILGLCSLAVALYGVAPSPEYTFLIYVSPVGNYFKEGTAPLNLHVEEEYHHASRGGVGGIKAITNYSPVLKAQAKAKNRGFSDVLYLDSNWKTNVEEASSSNVFIVTGNVISTPAPNGTILEGITRKSIIEIANDLGYQVEERCVQVDELTDAHEVFCTETAAGVAPVGSITYQAKRANYNMDGQLTGIVRRNQSLQARKRAPISIQARTECNLDAWYQGHTVTLNPTKLHGTNLAGSMWS